MNHIISSKNTLVNDIYIKSRETNPWASNETLELFTDSAGGQNRVWYLFSRKMGAKMLAKRMGRNGHS